MYFPQLPEDKVSFGQILKLNGPSRVRSKIVKNVIPLWVIKAHKTTPTRTRKTENRSRDPWVTGIWIYDLIHVSIINRNGAYGGFPYYAHNTIDHCFTLWAVNPTIYTHSIDKHLFCPILVQKHNVKWTFSWTLSKCNPFPFSPPPMHYFFSNKTKISVLGQYLNNTCLMF